MFLPETVRRILDGSVALTVQELPLKITVFRKSVGVTEYKFPYRSLQHVRATAENCFFDGPAETGSGNRDL